MMTFFEWYSTQPLNASANPLTFALQVWEVATLAERERCARVLEDTATGPLEYDLPAYVLQELAGAIRNP